MSKTTLRKGRQDDKFSLAIRDIQAASAANKKCFDCEQRGPTYINTTIGSFVCTKCSGMLRGINPPHRIKSISMSSFSADEVELMRSRGNIWCAAVWLGLFDSQPIDYKDEEKIKEFIVAKYEKKRYYVEPSQAQINRGSSHDTGSDTGSNSSKSGLASGSLIGSTLKARMDPSSQVNISVSRPGQGVNMGVPRAMEPPPRPPSNGLSSRPIPQTSQSVSFGSSVQTATPQSKPQPQPPEQPVQDFGNFANFDTAAFDSMPSDPLTNSAPVLVSGLHAATKDPPKLQQDKYSALAELDDLFKSSAIQPSESVFQDPTPVFSEPTPPAPPTADLFHSLLETSGTTAIPSVFGSVADRSTNGSPGCWGGSGGQGWGGRATSPRWTGGNSQWGEGTWPATDTTPNPIPNSLVPGGSHSTNPFGTSPSNPTLGAPYYSSDNNNDLFAAAPKPFFAEKPGAVLDTNPWTGIPAFTADMKPAHNPNNPFL